MQRVSSIFNRRRKEDAELQHSKIDRTSICENSCTSVSMSSIASLSTDNELVVEKFLNRFNDRDILSLKNLCTMNCTFDFVHSEMEMKMDDFIEENVRLVKSFPDMRIRWRRMNEIRPGVVQVGYFRTSGTHTGEPYGFGPYPEISANGRKVRNDPEQLTVHLVNGKIDAVKINPMEGSELVGPQGFYVQIGGFPL